MTPTASPTTQDKGLSTKRKADDQPDSERISLGHPAKQTTRTKSSIQNISTTAAKMHEEFATKAKHEETKGRSQSNNLSRPKQTDSQNSTGPSTGEVTPSSTTNSSSSGEEARMHTHEGGDSMRVLSPCASTTQKNSSHAKRKKEEKEKCTICTTSVTKSGTGSRCLGGPTGLGFRPGKPCCVDCIATLQKQLRWHREDQERKYPHLKLQNG